MLFCMCMCVYVECIHRFVFVCLYTPIASLMATARPTRILTSQGVGEGCGLVERSGEEKEDKGLCDVEA